YLMNTANQYSLDYIFGSTREYGPDPLTEDELVQTQVNEDSEVQFLNDPIRYAIRDFNHVPTTTLIRASVIPKNLQLPEQFLSCQDLALALRLFQHSKVGWVNRPVCFQLVNHKRRLSANEALTYFQTLEIIREFGEENFSGAVKHVAARKLVSRSLRWLRKNQLRSKMFSAYLQLLKLYI